MPIFEMSTEPSLEIFLGNEIEESTNQPEGNNNFLAVISIWNHKLR